MPKEGTALEIRRRVTGTATIRLDTDTTRRQRRTLYGIALLWWFLGTLRAVAPPWVLTRGIPNYGYYRYAFVHWAYSDVVALYATRNFYTHGFPYFQNRLEYPVGIGVFTWLTAWGPGFYGYYVLSAIGIGLALGVAVWALMRGRGFPAARWFAWSPLLICFALLNWDLLGIAALGMALLAWKQEKWWAAGLWLGLGTVIKFFPIVYLPYLLATLWKDRHRAPAAWKRLLGGFGLVAIFANLPFALGARSGWLEFFVYNSRRAPDPGLWSWVVARGWVPLASIDGWTLGFTLLGGVVLLIYLLRSRQDPLAIAAMALLWWFLCNKTWSPQYILWALYAVMWTKWAGLGPFVWISLAGMMDFGMAMVWLGMGQTHAPQILWFGTTIAPWIIAVRDFTLFGQLWGLAWIGRERGGGSKNLVEA